MPGHGGLREVGDTRRVRGLALLCVVSACIDSSSVPCDDGRTCPSGTVCATLTDPEQQLCVKRGQIEACRGKTELAECMLDGATLARCYQGVCLAAGCGNLRVDPDEACDDGNDVIGDGCSSACQSNETCGNAILDPVELVGDVAQANEQCDDANVQGHDGCTSTCASELPIWEPLLVGKPPARYDAAIAYDSARQRIVMFAGAFRAGGAVTRGDTWEWDGEGWRLLATPAAPPVRLGHVMAYDASRLRIVMFGGRSAEEFSTLLGDTWEFDGTRWALLAPAHTPSPRTNASAVYDPIHRRIVLFGGATAQMTNSLAVRVDRE